MKNSLKLSFNKFRNRNMTTILEGYGLRPVAPVKPLSLNGLDVGGVAVTSSEYIGIEVEVENVRDGRGELNRAWTVTQDGSLRNNGLEIVSKPIAAMFAPQMLTHLFSQYLNEDCCFGPRTSIHIHLNVQDLTLDQALDMVLVYAIYERLFYNFAGRGRQKNVYCVPLFDTDLLVNLVDYGVTRDRNWSKYTGLNTLPLYEYGTIEFRHMHGTTNVRKLATWINLICKLKEYVKRTNTATLRAMIATMHDGFDFGALMNDIFGEYASAFTYEGPQELNYLQAKQALVPRANVRHLALTASRDSAFLKFKGN
jgi:hypothetical protein